jgi:ribosomal protein S24E
LELKVLEERPNPLLKRTEFRFEVEHAGAATPKRDEVRSELARIAKVPKDRLIVERMHARFGTAKSRGEAFAYQTKEALEATVREHILVRNGLREKAVKGPTPAPEKPEGAPAVEKQPPAPAETKEKPPTESPAEKTEEKPVEKPAEKHAEKPAERPPEKAREKPHEKPAEKAPEKHAEKAEKKPPETPAEKHAGKPAPKPTEKPPAKEGARPARKAKEKPAAAKPEASAEGS